MSHIGLTVNRLIRTSYGPFRLNELQPGEVEEVRPRILREQLGLSEADLPSTPKPGRKPEPKPTAKPAANPGAKPAAKGRTLKPGEGLKQLSETWQKATRPPARKVDRAAPDRPTRPHGTPPRGGPRPGGPKKG
jgi:23S rRNA pseudouridine2605 synthase